MTQYEESKDHTTSYEIKFLEKLGTFSAKDCFASKFDRKTLLERYISAAKKRVDWGKLDKKECLDFARDQLRKA